MQLKIVGDGTAMGTRVVNAETGEMLKLVQSISYSLDLKTELATLTMTVLKVPMELNTEGTEASARELVVSINSRIATRAEESDPALRVKKVWPNSDDT